MRSFTIIGLTGPTGAGKSTVSKFLEEYGCYIIDADLLGRKALSRGSLCVPCLKSAFGDDITDDNGEIIRSLVAQRAFSTEENTRILNDITHPWICLETLKTVDRLRSEHESPVIVFDAAVLLESKMDILCDFTISVLAAENIRKERIIKRDLITEEQASLRISAQHSDNFYIEKSDYIIDGSKSLTRVREKTKSIIKEIMLKKGDEGYRSK